MSNGGRLRQPPISRICDVVCAAWRAPAYSELPIPDCTMVTPARRLAARYGASLLATFAALALRWALEPWLGTHVPFITIFGAVAFAAWYGGIGPAAVASIVGALCIEYLFELPRFEFAFGDTRALVIYGVYLAMCAIVTLLAELARRHARRAEHAILALQGDHLLRQQMIDALPMLVSYVDADARYRFNNRAYELWFGHERSAMAGRRMQDVLGDAAWQRVRPRVERALAGETVRFETTLDYKDAGRREVSIAYLPHREGDAVVGFFVLVDDISERRRAERAQAHLAAVVSSSDDAIVSKTLDGIVTSWNRGAEALYGYSADEMVGQPIERLVPPELRDEEADILARLARGERVDHLETERLTRDGRRVAVSLSISPIRDAEGHIIGASKIAHDITGRKAAEQALRDSELRFRTLADSTPMLVWRTDAGSRGVWFNRCWLEFTGSGIDQEAGDGWLRHMHPDDRPRIVTLRRAKQAGREVVETEYRLRHHDGSYRWMYERGVPMHDGPEGAFSGYIGSCIDITDRRHAEDELRRTFESIGDGFAVLDEQSRFVYVNAVAEEAVGHRREELVGQVFWEMFPLTRGTRLEQEFTRCMAGEVVDFENFYAPFNRWFRNRGFPRAGGGMTVYFQDITAEKRARRTLQESEEKFHKAFDTSPNVLAITTLGSDSFIEVNAAFERLTGYRRDAVIGHTAVDLGLWMDVARREQLLQQLRAGETVHDEEMTLRTRDGTLRTVLLSADLLVIDETPCVIASWLDISDQRELEQRLRESVERLAETDRRKDEFLATLAHELRNPLAPILSAAQFLHLNAALEPPLQRARDIIERQALHMGRLVDDLLDLARISRGQVTLRRSLVSLQQAITAAVEASEPHLEAAGHELRKDMPDEAVCVDGDFTRLSQVVGNLLGNAIKYTPPGGTISVALEHDAADAVIRVRDSGVGIRADMTERIFDMFTQAETSLERSQGGLGIGLTLARQLVEMHGGTLHAHSAGAGQGSEFVVRLPLRACSTPAVPAQREGRGAGPTRPLHILVADDSEDAALSLAMLLELHGHEVRTVHDGAAAVAAVAESMPDVVLLDIGMPRMNGYEAARRIRSLPGGDVVRLVALTGWGQAEDRRRTHEAGFDAHVTKPVAFEELQRLLVAPADAPPGDPATA
jgi:PAS domain S-box-containing protein